MSKNNKEVFGKMIEQVVSEKGMYVLVKRKKAVVIVEATVVKKIKCPHATGENVEFGQKMQGAGIDDYDFGKKDTTKKTHWFERVVSSGYYYDEKRDIDSICTVCFGQVEIGDITNLLSPNEYSEELRLVESTIWVDAGQPRPVDDVFVEGETLETFTPTKIEVLDLAPIKIENYGATARAVAGEEKYEDERERKKSRQTRGHLKI